MNRIFMISFLEFKLFLTAAPLKFSIPANLLPLIILTEVIIITIISLGGLQNEKNQL